jgi:nucleotide-binding universal stress UspA family protein
MFRQLLVPLDGSPLAEAAVPLAVEIARRQDLGIILTRVHSSVSVLPYPPEMPIYMPLPGLDDIVREQSEAWLKKRASELARSSGLRVFPVFRIGDPASEIVSVAARRRVRAIVCSTHGVGGLAPHWIGSVADAVVRHAPCPVFALPPNAFERSDTIYRVLVLLDTSEASDTILPQAEWLARSFDADLELLTVVAPPFLTDAFQRTDEDRFGVDSYAEAVKARLDAIVDDFRARGVRATAVVEIGASPVRTILAHIARGNPDAIALATSGRGLSRLILGSVADKVLRTSGRPTLMLHPLAVEGGKGNAMSGIHAGAVEIVGGL